LTSKALPGGAIAGEAILVAWHTISIGECIQEKAFLTHRATDNEFSVIYLFNKSSENLKIGHSFW
jgi:hypothetical protein